MPFPYHRPNSSQSSTSSGLSNSNSHNMTHRGGKSQSETSRMLMEQDNERQLEELGAQVSLLKSLTIDIHNEVESQNKSLDGMGDSFGSAANMFKNTITKLGLMLETGSSNYMYYLIAFIVFVFLVIYFSMGKK